jgi:hypothetical protein
MGPIQLKRCICALVDNLMTIVLSRKENEIEKKGLCHAQGRYSGAAPRAYMERHKLGCLP